MESRGGYTGPNLIKRYALEDLTDHRPDQLHDHAMIDIIF